MTNEHEADDLRARDACERKLKFVETKLMTDCSPIRGYLSIVERRMRQLQAQGPRWISVKEKMPGEGDCWVSSREKGKRGTRYQHRACFWKGEFLEFHPATCYVGLPPQAYPDVTHWMPLPEPPK